jgi:hypothetical protein
MKNKPTPIPIIIAIKRLVKIMAIIVITNDANRLNKQIVL